MDVDKLEKIVANLLSNALKFSGSEGKIGVSFDVITREEALEIFPLTVNDASTQWVKVTVADTGKGIPEDKLEKIFERYYQLDNQTNDKYNWGTGIGVITSYSIHYTKLYDTFLALGRAPPSKVRSVVRSPARLCRSKTAATRGRPTATGAKT